MVRLRNELCSLKVVMGHYPILDRKSNPSYVCIHQLINAYIG
jgi:hypothetical protein